MMAEISFRSGTVVRALGLFGLVLVLGACGHPDSDSRPQSERPHFVTTIAPFEMVLSPLVEGRGTVEYLLAPASSPHTYDPTPSDVRTVTTAEAFVYGAESLDGWAARLPANRTVGLLDLLPPTVRRDFSSTRRGGQTAVDPHFWTDPMAVARLVPALTDTLCAIDPTGCSTYRTNADSFATALTALDTQLEAMTRPVRDTPVLLAQPFFEYFLNRYGPQLVAVIQPSPGVEPTPRDLQRLVGRAHASGTRAILTQRQASGRVAAAVAEPTRLPMIELDPIGGISGRDTYRSLLLTNARILRDSLAQSSP